MSEVHTLSKVRAFTLAWLLVSLSSGLASALPQTLGSSLTLTGSEPGNTGVIGSINPVALDASLSDSFAVETGSTSFASNDVFAFQVTLANSSLDVDLIQAAASSTPFFGNPVGAGAFSDSPNQAPSAVTLPDFAFRGDFSFSGGTLEAGESSARLFVTFSPSGSALAIGRTASFTMQAGSSSFTVQANLVPEPSTAALLALSLSGLAIHCRKRNLAR